MEQEKTDEAELCYKQMTETDHNQMNTYVLHDAARYNNDRLLRFLLERHPHLLEQKNIDQLTPLYFAAQEHQAATTVLLLDKNADVNCNNNTYLGKPLYWTPLHGAVCYPNIPDKPSMAPDVALIVEKLLSNNADPHPRDVYGRTPLFLAAANDYVDVIQTLKDKGVDVNSRCEPADLPDIDDPILKQAHDMAEWTALDKATEQYVKAREQYEKRTEQDVIDPRERWSRVLDKLIDVGVTEHARPPNNGQETPFATQSSMRLFFWRQHLTTDTTATLTQQSDTAQVTLSTTSQ